MSEGVVFILMYFLTTPAIQLMKQGLLAAPFKPLSPASSLA
jgi:hypothetical protein